MYGGIYCFLCQDYIYDKDIEIIAKEEQRKAWKMQGTFTMLREKAGCPRSSWGSWFAPGRRVKQVLTLCGSHTACGSGNFCGEYGDLAQVGYWSSREDEWHFHHNTPGCPSSLWEIRYTLQPLHFLLSSQARQIGRLASCCWCENSKILG